MILIKIIFENLSFFKLFRKIFKGHWSKYESIIYLENHQYSIAYNIFWVPYKIKTIKTRIYQDKFFKDRYIQTYHLLESEEY